MSDLLWWMLVLCICTVEARVKCEDKSTCPSNNTSCLMKDGQCACCPAGPKAICCLDGKNCCPHGYICDLQHMACNKKNPGLSITRKLSKLQLDLSTDQSSGGDKQSYRVVCPDYSSWCPHASTCCKMADGIWGCCPLQDASCCTDGLHCCPREMKCDLNRQVCTNQNLSIPWQQKTKSHSLLIRQRAEAVICPDHIHMCANNQTCCMMADNQWGCCQGCDATCCSDHQHCCPKGFTCDMAHLACVKEGTKWQLTKVEK